MVQTFSIFLLLNPVFLSIFTILIFFMNFEFNSHKPCDIVVIKKQMQSYANIAIEMIPCFFWGLNSA